LKFLILIIDNNYFFGGVEMVFNYTAVNDSGSSSISSKITWIEREIQKLKDLSGRLDSTVFSDDKYSVGTLKTSLDTKITNLENKVDNLKKAYNSMQKWRW